MWFVDNHPDATRHRLLPWYHSKSELTASISAAPRQKFASARDFHIRHVSDWEKLKSGSVSGRVDRIIVEPIDPELIRNQKFADELGALSASKRFLIELSGGILSHVYYRLIRNGAQVECVDLFGASDDVIEYDKIVRDKIPGLISGRGERSEVIRLQGEALVIALRRKLVEEAFEALDAKSGDDLIGELADVEEVVAALCVALNVPVSHLRTEQKDKKRKRGGFEDGLMLIRTTTPRSIDQSAPQTLNAGLELQSENAAASIIRNPADLPERPLYRRPDLRQVD